MLTGSGWLRCRTHSANNLRAKTPKHAWSMVAGLLNSVFERPDAASVHRQYRELCAALDGKFPDAVALIESAETDVLAEQHEEWAACARRYRVESLAKARLIVIPGGGSPPAEEVKPQLAAQAN